MDNLQPGQTLGPYRIINQIGIGLFTWSGEDVASADVTFDDFLVISLE